MNNGYLWGDFIGKLWIFLVLSYCLHLLHCAVLPLGEFNFGWKCKILLWDRSRVKVDINPIDNLPHHCLFQSRLDRMLFPFHMHNGCNLNLYTKCNHGDKVSPTKKQGQIDTSRYSQKTTPNRNASSPQGSAMLSSQRNVYGHRISTYMEVEDVKAR